MGSSQVLAAQCNMKCKGNVAQTCGAGDRYVPPTTSLLLTNNKTCANYFDRLNVYKYVALPTTTLPATTIPTTTTTTTTVPTTTTTTTTVRHT